MGVAVLHPQDCLNLKNSSSPQPIISSPPTLKLPNPNPKPKPKPKPSRTTRTRPKRSHSTRPASTSDVKPKPQVNNNKLVMGQVKILKRGEQLTETAPDRQLETVKDEFRSTEVPTERVGGLYAGSSMYVASPPPSSVPLPAFVTKKIAAVTDATSDLRKILRLEFS